MIGSDYAEISNAEQFIPKAIPTKDVEVHSVDTATLRGRLPWFLRVESPNGLSLLGGVESRHRLVRHRV
jgi:hypothetical protein